MKILIIGDGFVGNSLKYAYEKLGHTVFITTRRKQSTTEYLNFEPANTIKYQRIIYDINPDMVIYTIGIKDIAKCQKCQFETYRINAIYPATLSMYSSNFVYISTDYVFDGIKGNYIETDRTIPYNNYVYGKSKIHAEEMVKGYIIRTGGLYDELFHSTWAQWLQEQLESDTYVQAYDKTYNTPTNITDLAISILSIISDNIGIYHVAGNTRINRYELFKLYARSRGFSDKLIIKSASSQPSDLSLKSIKYPPTRGIEEFI